MHATAAIRAARRRAGLSLRDLASRAQTSHSTVSAYETGRKIPTAETLDRLVVAAGFDLTVSLVPRPGDGDPADRGRELEEVLGLAAQFPARHEPTLTFPPFAGGPASGRP